MTGSTTLRLRGCEELRRLLESVGALTGFTSLVLQSQGKNEESLQL